MIQGLLIGIMNFIFGILDFIFGLVPSIISIPVSWVPYAKGLMDWASYFLPVYTIYAQFIMVTLLLQVYIVIRLIIFIRSH